jgi:hypothetical protein
MTFPITINNNHNNNHPQQGTAMPVFKSLSTLDVPITELELSVRCLHALEKLNVETLRGLRNVTKSDFTRTAGMVSLRELRLHFREYVHFMDEPAPDTTHSSALGFPSDFIQRASDNKVLTYLECTVNGARLACTKLSKADAVSLLTGLAACNNTLPVAASYIGTNLRKLIIPVDIRTFSAFATTITASTETNK